MRHRVKVIVVKMVSLCCSLLHHTYLLRLNLVVKRPRERKVDLNRRSNSISPQPTKQQLQIDQSHLKIPFIYENLALATCQMYISRI